MGHYKSVEVKTVAVDFTQGETIYDELRRQLHDLEIGVLVNNVGMAGGFGHLFAADANPQYIFDTINCNVLSATTMSHIVLSGMEQRRRGVIINVASLAGVSVAPYHAVYGATKVRSLNSTTASFWWSWKPFQPGEGGLHRSSALFFLFHWKKNIHILNLSPDSHLKNYQLKYINVELILKLNVVYSQMFRLF